MIEVNDATHLGRLPDGTIISWLRIPGDPTSEAVAFVHHQDEQAQDVDGRPVPFGTEAPGELPGMMRTTWISPGGWSPMSIEDAEITYPVRVVRIGAGQSATGPWPSSGTGLTCFGAGWPIAYGATAPNIGEHYEEPAAHPLAASLSSDVDPEMLLESGVLAHGGTWAREKALECAARFLAGTMAPLDGVLGTAEAFEQWLDRETDEDAPTPPTYDAVTQDKLDFAADLLHAVGTEKRAASDYGLKITTAHIGRMYKLAMSIKERRAEGRRAMRVVAGCCPMGCGRKLILLPDGRVWCNNRTCPHPGAMAEIMADDETEHIARINERGQFVALVHPLGERLDRAVLGCSLIESAVADIQNDHAPTDGGDYRIVYVGHDPVSSTLYAPMCSWEKLDAG